MVNITVHHIWKDFFCCVFAWDFRCWCESCKSEAQISLKGRVPGSREEPPPGSLGGLARIGLVLAEKLFSSISSLRVLKQQQSYLKDHGGIALSSVFSFLSQGKAHDLRAAHSLLSPRLLWSNGLGGWKYLYLSKIKKPGSIKTSHIDLWGPSLVFGMKFWEVIATPGELKKEGESRRSLGPLFSFVPYFHDMLKCYSFW